MIVKRQAHVLFRTEAQIGQYVYFNCVVKSHTIVRKCSFQQTSCSLHLYRRVFLLVEWNGEGRRDRQVVVCTSTADGPLLLSTPRADHLYDLFPLYDLDLSGQI